MAFLQSGVFVRHDPETASVPLVVDVSRSGRCYPKVESIMVEINKKLFMDTKTFRKTEGFGKLKSDLDRLLKTLAAEAGKRSRK